MITPAQDIDMEQAPAIQVKGPDQPGLFLLDVLDVLDLERELFAVDVERLHGLAVVGNPHADKKRWMCPECRLHCLDQPVGIK